MRLVRIGYWSGHGSGGWPDPRSFIDLSWDERERADVRDYLTRGFVAAAFMGRSLCRLCGAEAGSLELSDGAFVWPEGLAHYVSIHSVRLPERFVEHVLEMTGRLQQADVDEDWWRSLGEPD
jgi:hypothetical protein